MINGGRSRGPQENCQRKYGLMDDWSVDGNVENLFQYL